MTSMAYLQPTGDARIIKASCSSCCTSASLSTPSAARDRRLATGVVQPGKKAARPRPSIAQSTLDDAELEGIPQAFLRDSLLLLAPRLLAGANSVVPVLPPSYSAFASIDLLPPSLDCLLEPPPSTRPAGYALVPTHVLAATIPSPTCAGTVERVLVPVHSLPWSLASPALGAHLAACAAAAAAAAPCSLEVDEARPAEPAGPPTPPASPPSHFSTAPPRPLGSTPPPPPASHLTLPVVPLSLPSLAGLTALHAFIYTRTLGGLPLDDDALAGAGACAHALGVEGEVGRELEAALREAWARLRGEGGEGSAGECEADDEEWWSEEGEDGTGSAYESACESA